MYIFAANGSMCQIMTSCCEIMNEYSCDIVCQIGHQILL